MFDTDAQFLPDHAVHLALEVLPIEEEEDDLDTLATVGQIQSIVQQDVAQTEGYLVKPLATSEGEAATRGIDVTLLITALGAAISTHQELLISIFKALATVVEVLAKRGRVQEIQIIADGRTLILKDVSKKTAQELIATFEAQHPGVSAQLTTQSTIQVKAKVSKKGKKKS